MKILTSRECRAIVNAVTDNALIAQQNVLYRDLDPKELGIITDRIADNTLPILARIGKQCDLTNLMTAIGDMGTARKNVNEWRKKRYGWHPSSDIPPLDEPLLCKTTTDSYVTAKRTSATDWNAVRTRQGFVEWHLIKNIDNG